MKRSKIINRIFDKFSTFVIRGAGHPAAFILSLLTVLVWAITGPLFHFSDTWQLTINTGTSVITFLMVFVLQQSQNKDTLALQLKLNELLAVNKAASNRLINSEDMTQEELEILKRGYAKMGKFIKTESNKKAAHSIEEEKGNDKRDK